MTAPGPPVIPTHLYLSPNPLNLGTTNNGGTATGSFHITSSGGFNPITWSITGNTDASFVLGPPINGTLSPSSSVSIPVSVTKPGAGDYSTTVTIHGSDGVNYTLTINVTFADLTGTLSATPSAVNFPKQVLGTIPATANILLVNNDPAIDAVVTALQFVGLPFSSTIPVPFTVVHGGGNQLFVIDASPLVVGNFVGSVTVKSNFPDIVIPLSSSVVFVDSVDVLTGATVAVLLGFGDATIEKFDGSSYDSALNDVLIFNGSLWNNPGNEKTLARLEVYYENVGVCTGLKLDLKVWRPSTNAYDTLTKTITIGDALADNSERSAYFDVNLSGEVIEAKLTRLASTGPVSILGFIPWFSDRGEKVENV